MTIVKLLNRHFIGGIWIDARLSDSTQPFVDCEVAPGFPCKIEYLDSVEIDLGNWTEIRYRTEQDPIKNPQKVLFSPDVYRIACFEQNELVIAEIVDNE